MTKTFDLTIKRKSTLIEEFKIKFNNASDKVGISKTLTRTFESLSDFDTFMIHVISASQGAKNPVQEFLYEHKNFRFIQKRIGNYLFLISFHKYFDRGLFRIYHFFVDPVF